MINRLRKKFIAVSMISVFIVLAVLIGAINAMNYFNIVKEADETLKIISENGGTMPSMQRRDMTEPPASSDKQKGSGKTDSSEPPAKPEGSSDADSSEPPTKPDESSTGGNNRGNGFDKDIRNHRRAEMFFDTRYFTVTFDDSGKILTSNTSKIAAISGYDAKEIAKEIYSKGKDRGFSGNYRFITRKTTVDILDGGDSDSEVSANTNSEDYENSDSQAGDSIEGTMVICVDCYRGLGNFRTFLLYSVLVSLAGLIAVFILVVILSRRVVKPVAESYEKQKQFITDAGHELKTPLTVIDADLSVLDMEGVKSEWLDDIKLQSRRLAGLTNELVYLSRMDEGRKVDRIEFPISDMVSEEVQSFAARAKVEGKTLDSEIEHDITYSGDQKMIKELVSILVDNAIKYSDNGDITDVTEGETDRGTIRISLMKSGNGVELASWNTVKQITQEQADKMFDRFYRADASRSEKSGYGLGLSIAKAVCEAHGGSIRATSAPDGKSITITAKLS